MPVLLYDPSLREQDPASRDDLVYDAIEFDAVVQITHSSQSKVTSHPVESGESLADHSIPGPREIQLADAVVTDFPLLLPGESVLEQAMATGSYSADSLGSLGLDAIAVEPLAARAYQQLERWRKEGRALEIHDDFETYERVLIQSISVPRSASTGNAMIAQIRLVEVEVAESRLVDAPVTERAAPKKSQGPKAKTPATSAEEEAGNNTMLESLLF